MPDISSLTVKNVQYDIKDATARTAANAAQTTATAAQNTANEAQTTANEAQTTATAAQNTANGVATKVTQLEITGTLDEENLTLTIGGVS